MAICQAAMTRLGWYRQCVVCPSSTFFLAPRYQPCQGWTELINAKSRPGLVPDPYAFVSELANRYMYVAPYVRDPYLSVQWGVLGGRNPPASTLFFIVWGCLEVSKMQYNKNSFYSDFTLLSNETDTNSTWPLRPRNRQAGSDGCAFHHPPPPVAR